MRTAFLLTPMLVLALVGPAIASGCTPTTHDADVTSPTCLVEGAPCHYVADDFCLLSLLSSHRSFCSIWVYEESNGIAGLQRGDEVVDDTCNGVIRADTIIF